MSLDALPPTQQRIAIIGGGISGLAAAYLLAPGHAVTLYEASHRLGGHARTITAGLRADQPVDTGFIVFNYANYPHLTRMFRDLDVPVTKSEMSFGATIDDGRIEYALTSLNALFAQRRNMANPAFLRMVRDLFRFNDRAEALARDDSATIGDLMKDLQLGDWFQRYYLTPFCGAIWSTPPDQIRQFPARAIVQFFRNHALLETSGQHQWWTVDGGSVEYVRRLEHHLRGRGVALRKGTPVRGIDRAAGQVTIHTGQYPAETFDHVIFACHADQALHLIRNPGTAERNTLSAMRFQDNQMILHRDASQMPRRRPVWASWVYRADTSEEESAIGVTYWMNKLQNIPETDPLFVSLNPSREVPQHLIYDQTTFRHPVFDRAALTAQQTLKEIQGENNTWFAGAYTRHGFHEDGFASAVRVVRQMDRQFATQMQGAIA